MPKARRDSLLFDSLGAGALGGVLALLAELVLVVAFRGSRLTGAWEILEGVLGLLPAWLLGAMPFGALGGLLTSRAAESPNFRRESAVVGGVLGAIVGYGVGGGRHLASAGLRLGFSAAVALAAGGVALALAPRFVARVRGCRSGASPWTTADSAKLATLLLATFLTNQFVLVRLYPAFHYALSVASLATAGSALALPLRSRGPIWGAKGLVAVVFLGSAVLLRPWSERVRGLDNLRYVVSEGSPTLKVGVLLTSLIAPPPALDVQALNAPLGSRAARPDAPSLRGRSFLLLSIDALRADHLGAYGYARPTTPVMDALAAAGFVFDAAYAATPHTSYSLTSLLTGKYMRPLLLQGAGEDSDLLPGLLQTYGYRTGAFYPPAVFFVAKERFGAFERARFGFQYGWVEFAEGEKRVQQVEAYLKDAGPTDPLFVWVHLFGPHEPYETGAVDFGKTDLDRYDSEIRSADQTVGELVKQFRAARPGGVVILTADHGEEFGEHGGRYHGTSVYEEQVRVPLIWNAEGTIRPGRYKNPVQTIDIMPTMLSALDIPVPPRVRGRDLSRVIWGSAQGEESGFAAAETETMTLVAEGQSRLICARDTGACQLFDIESDAHEERDISSASPELFQRLRQLSVAHAASHGTFETRGLRREGKNLPTAILRGLSGDREVAPELERLLDDADPILRRKSAELLFSLGSEKTLPALRLALAREEDQETKNYLGLALTRWGESSGLTYELLDAPDIELRRRAALALAFHGDARGKDILVEWFQRAEDESELQTLLDVFGDLRLRAAVPILIARLDEVRLRPAIARALGKIGDKTARPFLLARLLTERYVSTRLPLIEALRILGAKSEMASPLVTFLGMPDPLPSGLQVARDLDILAEIGGPSRRALADIARLGDAGVRIRITIPAVPKGYAKKPVRLLILGRAKGTDPAEVRIETSAPELAQTGPRFRSQPLIGTGPGLKVTLTPGTERQWLVGRFPVGQAGGSIELSLYAPPNAEVSALALVPEREEFPPPPPEPGPDAGSSHGTSRPN